MMHDHYELDKAIQKVTEPFVLFHSDKASIEIGNDTFAVPIQLESERVGYAFLGQGKLLVDAIVETEKGALGKSIQRSLNEPFLMLGDTDETSRHFNSANNDDFRKASTDEKMVLDRAQELLDRFSGGSSVHRHEHVFSGKGSIFAFSDDKDELDILLSKGSKLVYTTRDMSFLTDGDKAILTRSGQVVLSHHGRPFVVEMPHHSACDC
jgi:hypothetical protein